MREWNQYCLVDIFSQIDPALLEDDCIEDDLDNLKLWPEEKTKWWSKKKVAVITGIAAGTVAITGAVIFMCKKGNWLKKAA